MFTAKLYKKLNSGVQCKSDDELLGEYPSLIECSKACRKKNGCNFFQYGKDTKKGKCIWENTTGSNCPEGWQDDDYDFYELISMVHYFYLYLTYKLKYLKYISPLIFYILINSRTYFSTILRNGGWGEM